MSARRDHLVDVRVVGRELEGLRYRLAPHTLPRKLDRIADGRVHAKAQDVHLHEPERLDVVLVVLGDDHALGRPLQRRPGVDGLARDDEAAEVRAEVHRAGVELFGKVDDLRVDAALLSGWSRHSGYVSSTSRSRRAETQGR